VPDGDVPGELAQGGFIEYLGDQAHFSVELNSPAVRGGYAGALLATVLKCEEGEKG